MMKARLTRAQRTGGFLGTTESTAEMRSEETKEGEDLVYYNAVLYNDTTEPIKAYINDLRGQSVIDIPEEWHMSVVRFVCPGELLPLAIVPMNDDTIGAMAQTSLRLSLVATGGIFQEYVTIQNDGPVSGSIFSYDYLVTRINVALTAAWTAITGPRPPTSPPFLSYDPVLGAIRLYFQASYLDAVDPISIRVNWPLYQYMSGIPATIYGYAANGVFDDVWINLEANSVMTVPIAVRDGFPVAVQAATMAGQVYFSQQEADNLQTWNGLSSLFLTTNYIPVQPEYLPAAGNITQNAGVSTASRQVISDFSAWGDANPLKFRQQIEYLPTAEFRMIHLAGRETLKRIDVQFWYTGPDGLAHEVMIAPGATATVKLLFRRKGAW